MRSCDNSCLDTFDFYKLKQKRVLLKNDDFYMIGTKWLNFYSCFEFKTTLLSALTMIIVML